MCHDHKVAKKAWSRGLKANFGGFFVIFSLLPLEKDVEELGVIFKEGLRAKQPLLSPTKIFLWIKGSRSFAKSAREASLLPFTSMFLNNPMLMIFPYI